MVLNSSGCATTRERTPTMTSPTPKRVCCAIYTRVSDDQGLEQDFNSLDAQYDASQSYIRSQAHADWTVIPSKYADGGFTGGDIDRDRLLRLYGFDVQMFGSAEEFLKGSNPRDVGLLVLDINLSGMSGIELRQKLALSGISIPVIFITGNDSDAIRNAALEVGCTAYLSKPFPAKQLVDAIEKAFNVPQDLILRQKSETHKAV